jgi:hypothetical protein
VEYSADQSTECLSDLTPWSSSPEGRKKLQEMITAGENYEVLVHTSDDGVKADDCINDVLSAQRVSRECDIRTVRSSLTLTRLSEESMGSK